MNSMAILEAIKKAILGDKDARALKDLQPIVDTINSLEPDISALSDDALKAKTPEFRKRIENGESLDDLLPEAFAVVREAGIRVLNMRHFDVQLIGGIVLHQGRIAEMKTGEGKTLVSTLPCYLNALEGKGVYMVTVNDYLAKRDSEWMGDIFTFLGLSVGLIQSGMDQGDRLNAYKADITYGTNNEYGFDYLRDHLNWNLDECCQTQQHYAIIDEVDSILIDEARTPLIISGPIPDSTEKYKKIIGVVRSLKQDEHFTKDEKHKNVVLTEEGTELIESKMGLSNIYSTANMEVAHMAVQCLKAMHLFKKDVDYVIKDGNVMIVDEFTGRILEGRRYSDGLHQAIEASENLVINEESQTLASITYQNYFRLFPKLAGMTGTAKTEEEEFVNIYGMDVVSIPTNKVIARQDLPDVIYKSKEEKYNAVVRDIKARHKKGQPVLVGSITIETSELISKLLMKETIPHNVLNAKHHEKEAEIIAGAGQKGAVTIATNMAGRGTDIKLGDGVLELGGLYVLGTERHESRRIDNQLRGRSGRQGDAGESKFFVALNDDLMRLFGSDRIAKVMETLGIPDDTPIEHGLISKSIERAQKKVEQYHYSTRKHILEYDDVMDKQRNTVYKLRREIVAKDGLIAKLHDQIDDIVVSGITSFGVTFTDKDDSATLEEFSAHLKDIFPISNMDELVQKAKASKEPHSELSKFLKSFLAKRLSDHPAEIYDEVIKSILLRNLDSKWMDHLHNMDVLREGIGLRAYGQKNPLMEYKMEGFDMFRDLLHGVFEESIKVISRVEVVAQGDALPEPKTPALKSAKYSSAKGVKTAKDAPQSSDKIGRNDPCPCGSGKKHKKCCGAS